MTLEIVLSIVKNIVLLGSFPMLLYPPFRPHFHSCLTIFKEKLQFLNNY